MPTAIEASTLGDALARRRLFGVEEPPPRVGRFRVEGRLGSGGMGTVWAAHDEELDRPVALKFLHPRASSNPRQIVDEARSLAQINHPNVIAVYDVGDLEGQVWIAMELVPGTTLRPGAGGDDGGPALRLERWLMAGEGLAAVHAAGLVHRDVKPTNVLLGDDGRVRLIDFGLVCAPRYDQTSDDPERPNDPTTNDPQTRAFGFAGTWAYAAPEQRRGGQELDARADQFSFCVAVWESLTGSRPDPSVEPRSLRPPEMSRRVHRALCRGLATSPPSWRRWPPSEAADGSQPRSSARGSRGSSGLASAPLRSSPIPAQGSAARSQTSGPPCVRLPSTLLGRGPLAPLGFGWRSTPGRGVGPWRPRRAAANRWSTTSALRRSTTGGWPASSGASTA